MSGGGSRKITKVSHTPNIQQAASRLQNSWLKTDLVVLWYIRVNIKMVQKAMLKRTGLSESMLVPGSAGLTSAHGACTRSVD